jgi:TetR/AcrR family transcriptional regulator
MGVAARRQREKEERRAAILQSAEKVFANKGVALATMDDIAHEAELSKGTLYLYFDSKDELYLEIAVRAVRSLQEDFSAAHGMGGTGYARLAAILRAYARFGVEHRDRFRVAVSWMTADPGAAAQSERFAEYKRLVVEIYGLVASAIEAGKRDGSLRSDLETSSLFAQLWGAVQGVLALQLNAAQIASRIPGEVRLDDIVTPTIALLLRSIRTGAGANAEADRDIVARIDARSDVA